MKKLKKLCALGISALLCSSSLGMDANALFGNSHYNIGQKILESSKFSLSESEKQAFLSGMVYATIGKFEFDKKINIKSDSAEFIEEMKKHAKTSEEEWFIKGFEMHTLQNEKVSQFFEKVFGQKLNLEQKSIAWSLTDAYLRKKYDKLIYIDFFDKLSSKQIYRSILTEMVLDQAEEHKQEFGEDYKYLSEDLAEIDNTINMLPVESIVKGYIDEYQKSAANNKNELVLYGNLLKDTYKSLGLDVSLEDIYGQAANAVAESLIATYFSKHVDEDEEITDEDAAKAETALNIIADACISEFFAEKTDANK